MLKPGESAKTIVYLDEVLLPLVLGEELQLLGVDGAPPLLPDQLHGVLSTHSTSYLGKLSIQCTSCGFKASSLKQGKLHRNIFYPKDRFQS